MFGGGLGGVKVDLLDPCFHLKTWEHAELEMFNFTPTNAGPHLTIFSNFFWAYKISCSTFFFETWYTTKILKGSKVDQIKLSGFATIIF